MALYEYRCDNCTKTFDIRCQMSEVKETTICPSCGGVASRRYKPIAFSFGWRLTDRANNERFGPRDEYEKNI